MERNGLEREHPGRRKWLPVRLPPRRGPERWRDPSVRRELQPRRLRIHVGPVTGPCYRAAVKITTSRDGVPDHATPSWTTSSSRMPSGSDVAGASPTSVTSALSPG